MQISLKTHSCNINLNAESWKCEDQQNSHVQSLQWSSDFLRPFFCLREIRKCQWSNMFSSPAWLASVKVSWDSKRITICHGVGISSWHIFGSMVSHEKGCLRWPNKKQLLTENVIYHISNIFSQEFEWPKWPGIGSLQNLHWSERHESLVQDGIHRSDSETSLIPVCFLKHTWHIGILGVQVQGVSIVHSQQSQVTPRCPMVSPCCTTEICTHLSWQSRFLKNLVDSLDLKSWLPSAPGYWD